MNFSCISGSCSHMAYSFYHRALTGVCVNCVYRHWFLKVFLSLCSDFHDRIMTAFKLVLSEHLKLTFSLLIFTLDSCIQGFLQISKLLDNMIYCRLWDIQSLIIFLSILHCGKISKLYFSMSFLQISWLMSIFTSNKKSSSPIRCFYTNC